MTMTAAETGGTPPGAFEPLGEPVFRNIWIGSLFSNFGLLVQGVGAAWAMTLIADPSRVALVQTATLAPYMLFAIAAGAIADMYSRRAVQSAALLFSFACAASLTVLSWLGGATPGLLLLFCFLIGTGTTMFSPAWQASASEQVTPRLLPSAVALNSISYNVARSFGPAVGGAVVAIAGTSAAFLCNALFYVPLILLLRRWRPVREPNRLPPERLARAILAGLRYVQHSPPIRAAALRALSAGVAGSAIQALLPVVARNLLHGDSVTYGWLLGAEGIGAVAGAIALSRIGAGASARITAVTAIIAGLCIAGVAFSTSALLTFAILLVHGATWMTLIATLSICVQVPSPRWVSGRTVAIFQATIAGGVALGSWLWGLFALDHGMTIALVASGAALAATPILGLFIPLGDPLQIEEDGHPEIGDPDVAMAVTGRSGPVLVEIEYQVALNQARAFYHHMQPIQRIRSANGAYGWSLSRDIGDPELWLERFHCPTWNDYLRQRTRSTPAEVEVMIAATRFHPEPRKIRVRRSLERPFGSVRWKDEVAEQPDPMILPGTGTLTAMLSRRRARPD